MMRSSEKENSVFQNNVTTTTTTPNSNSIEEVEMDKIAHFKQRIVKFEQIFEEQMKKFHTEHDNLYYIVSLKYLEVFRKYCKAGDLKKASNMSINLNLINKYQNLRPNLVQTKDYVLFNQKLYSLIDPKKGFKLSVSTKKMGRNKKVFDIYQDLSKAIKVNYICLDIQTLLEIGEGKKNEDGIDVKSIELAMDMTIHNTLETIKNYENLQNAKLRLWKIPQKFTKSKLFNFLEPQLFKLFSNEQIIGFRDQLSDDLTIIQSSKEQEFYIIECVNQKQQWIFKANKNSDICSTCSEFLPAKFSCHCNQAQYCCYGCYEWGQIEHLPVCQEKSKQVNDNLLMKMYPNSALGSVGLLNIGNTCYMNSCLQSLSGTIPLTEYFLKRYYEKEISEGENSSDGSGLARIYADFIQNMWCEPAAVFIPWKLKFAIAKFNQNFRGFEQHDAQEFFSYFIDSLHEDLNRVKHKSYITSNKHGQDCNMAEAALEDWLVYTRRNQSIIVDLMTGMYQSKVSCPDCKKQSISFETFTTISLPIPEQKPKSLQFFLHFSNFRTISKRLSLKYKFSSKTSLLEYALEKINRKPNNFIFYLLSTDEDIIPIDSSLSKEEIIDILETENKEPVLIELSNKQANMKERQTFLFSFCQAGEDGKYEESLWFRRPFFFQREGLNGERIIGRVLQYLYHGAYNNNLKRMGEKGIKFTDYLRQKIQRRPFTLFLRYEKQQEKSRVTFLKEEQIEDKTDIIALLNSYNLKNLNDFEIQVRIIDRNCQDFTFMRMRMFIDEVSEKENLQQDEDMSEDEDGEITLEECFEEFQEKERLDCQNHWYCSVCQQKKEAFKQIRIYKAPEILTLHLKKFKTNPDRTRQKNTNKIIIPFSLSSKKFTVDPTPMSSFIPQMQENGIYLNPPYKIKNNENKADGHYYDLYAICRHDGSLQQGHYVANVRKENGKWLQFDDGEIFDIGPDVIKSLISEHGYMLFYRRREGIEIL